MFLNPVASRTRFACAPFESLTRDAPRSQEEREKPLHCGRLLHHNVFAACSFFWPWKFVYECRRRSSNDFTISNSHYKLQAQLVDNYGSFQIWKGGGGDHGRANVVREVA